MYFLWGFVFVGSFDVLCMKRYLDMRSCWEDSSLSRGVHRTQVSNGVRFLSCHQSRLGVGRQIVSGHRERILAVGS